MMGRYLYEDGTWHAAMRGEIYGTVLRQLGLNTFRERVEIRL